MQGLDEVVWSQTQLGEAMLALVRASGLCPQEVEVASPGPLRADDDEQTGVWIDHMARHLGLEAESVPIPYGQVETFLSQDGPAIVRLPGGNRSRLLALLGGRRSVRVVTPSGAVEYVPPDLIHTALCGSLESRHQKGIEEVLNAASVPPGHRVRARRAMLRSVLTEASIPSCWRLRQPASAPVWDLAWQAHLPQRLFALLGVHTVQYVLWLLAWWLIGRATLQGRLDGSWLLTWGLLLFTLIPFRLLGTWLQGLVAVSLGGLLKQRLLRGALNLEPDDTGQQGVGELFGRVLEADRVEALALSGGFIGLVALIELGFATLVVGLGAGGWVQAGLLLGWLGATGFLSWHYVRKRRNWSENRLDLTQSLVESMMGHRTRLVQELHATWHAGADQALEGYVHRSRPMDRMMTWVLGGAPRGWLVLGTAGLAPAFVAGTASTGELAISLGGMLLAYRALEKVSVSLVHLADAGIAWKQIAPLFQAAARTESLGAPAGVAQSQVMTRGETLLEGHDLEFRYGERSAAVLRGCNIRIKVGDHLLLQGASGGGKSTLAAVLSGLRQAQSGLLLWCGLDRTTLGAQTWRQRVVAVPQFHDNRVVSGPLAFNLLMGRRWPPTAQDLQDAEHLCRDLGLGDLLERMPGGLLQMVGETGWQLSHGEQSRLFMARALLQRADLVVLDESFAALDPSNLERALHCVHARAETLMVIAHP